MVSRGVGAGGAGRHADGHAVGIERIGIYVLGEAVATQDRADLRHTVRLGERHLQRALRRNRQVGGHHVDLARRQPVDQAVEGDRHHLELNTQVRRQPLGDLDLEPFRLAVGPFGHPREIFGHADLEGTARADLLQQLRPGDAGQQRAGHEAQDRQLRTHRGRSLQDGPWSEPFAIATCLAKRLQLVIQGEGRRSGGESACGVKSIVAGRQ